MDKLTPVESEISQAGGKALSLPTDVGETSLIPLSTSSLSTSSCAACTCLNSCMQNIKKHAGSADAIVTTLNPNHLLTVLGGVLSLSGIIMTTVSTAGKPAEVIVAFDKIKEQLGHPEILIYNAGPGGVTFPPPSNTFLHTWRPALVVTNQPLHFRVLR